MNPTTETLTGFVYAGPFALSTLIGIGVALLLVIAGLSWWETRSRPWTLLPVLLLRAAAMAVILWALAGPSMETRTRLKTPGSIDIFLDTSASMTVADPADGSLQSLRWNDALHPGETTLTSLDIAAVAVEGLHDRIGAFLTGASSPFRHPSPRTGNNSPADALFGDCVARLNKAADAAVSGRNRLEEMQDAFREEVAPVASLLDQYAHRPADLPDSDFTRLRTAQIHLRQMAAALRELAAAYENAPPPDVSREEVLSRAEKSTRLLELAAGEWLREIERDASLRLYRFDKNIYPTAFDERRLPLESAELQEALATDLTAPLRKISEDTALENLRAAVLFTDGIHNTPGDPVRLASGLAGAPLFIVPIGNADPVRDVILHHVQAPRAVFLNDRIVIEGSIDAHDCTGEDVTVLLIEGRQTLDSETFTVTSDVFMHRFSLEAKAEDYGTRELTLQVQALPNERVPDNNSESVRVDVIENEFRVFLADNLPRWEYRYLRNLFDRDERVVQTELLYEPRRDGNRPATGDGLPRSLEDWSRFHAVILGDLTPEQLTADQQQHLVDYVGERGGILILIAGRDSMPQAYAGSRLKPLIPVEPTRLADPPDGYHLAVAAEGRDLPVTRFEEDPLQNRQVWEDLLPIYGISEWSKPKPIAHTLIHAQANPNNPDTNAPAFLCWMPYGSGRVVYLSAPESHRFRYRYGDRYHHRFWGQLLRWAIANDMGDESTTVLLSTDKTRYRKGDAVSVTLKLRHPDGRPFPGALPRAIARRSGIQAAGIDLFEEETNPGVYRGVLEDLPPGAYELTPAGTDVDRLRALGENSEDLAASFVIDPEEALELRNTRCNLALLQQIAEAGGGRLLPPAGLETALRQIDLSPEVRETVRHEPLWNNWLTLALFLGFISTEWILRKLAGLA